VAEQAEIRSPFTGELVGRIAVDGPEAVEAAVAAAVRAFAVTRHLSRFDRSTTLARIAAAIGAVAEDIARTIALEAGKPIAFARQEVARAVTTFTLAAEEAKRLAGEPTPVDIEERTRGYDAIVTRVPVGPVLAITPFNFPLNLVAHKVAPALAAGCPVVLKPAPQAPLTARRLGEIVAAAGAPPGALAVLHCPVALAEALVADDRLRMLTFTGSARVGWGLKARAGRKRVLLELGGDASLIVHADADVETAARKAAVGAFAYAGQVCISVQHILVHDDVYERFRERLLAETAALPVGDPLDPATVVGPLIDAANAERVLAWIAEARQAGARLLCGGTRAAGNVVTPTVLEGVPRGVRIAEEEVFGPVVTLDRYRDAAEALARVNASRYGLQAGLFTNDLRLVRRAFAELEVGALIVNDSPMLRVDSYPYGGTKESGLGREGVRSAIEAMTEPRVLVLAP
jgi:acyl-CoA reductase-like NAD-dependent aldehyde dehydrogenase